MLFGAILIAVLCIMPASAQTTEFTYQGQLQNSSTPANGSFDFEFALFDTAASGSQIGSTLTRSGVSVTGGIFSVNLDFGSSFPGANRFLEIRVRQSGGGSFVSLSPRQPVSSAPYSVKSLTADSAQSAATALNATNAESALSATNFTGSLAGDVTGSQGSTTVARLRGRNVAANQPNNGQVLKYNTASTQWEPANDETAAGGGGTLTGITAGTGLAGGGTSGSVTLSIANSGVGTAQIADASVTDAKIVGVSGAKVSGSVANATNAATAANANQLGGIAASGFIQNNTSQQLASNFNVSGDGTVGGIFSATQYNLGASKIFAASGSRTFFGIGAGSSTTGDLNTFFGRSAGAGTTTTTRNAFFGSLTGPVNAGERNSFFGHATGNNNTTGDNNSYFGDGAGFLNEAGFNNAMFGSASGLGNQGSFNTFIGAFSGQTNSTGTRNTVLGYGADVTVGNLTYAAAIGSGATVGTSNTMVLGRSNGNDAVQIPGSLTVAGNLTLNGTYSGPIPAGSGNYIQNSIGQQAASNFNISGNGTLGGTLTATNISASNQFNIGGNHILSRPGAGNLFAGTLAGQNNTGTQNSFFGHLSGSQNSSGVLNAFFGYLSGQNTTTGSSNAFFGADAGKANVSGAGNSFFGRAAGQDNITGDYNSFFGFSAGPASVVGTGNAFIGYQSGQGSTAGDENAFVGYRSGFNNTLGDNNTLIGSNADVTSGNLSFAAAIGSGATVSSSNTIALGRSGGQDTVRIPGDLFVLNGTDAEPGSGGYIISGLTSSTNIVIDNNEIMARNNGATATLALNADGGNVHLIQAGTGNVGIGTTAPDQKLTVNGNASKTGGTSWAVFSDERLKNIKGKFSLGLDVIRQLQPVRFEYRPDNPLGLADTGEQIGFSAQEVQKVLPAAVTTSRNGYLQLNVDPILWTMLNGIKEQDAEMERLRNQVREQTAVIGALKKALCEMNPLSEICNK